MSVMSGVLGAERQVGVEFEHQPTDVERRIGGIEQRLTALMATRGKDRERADGLERVVTYSWPSFDQDHRWTARRVLHMTAPPGEEWRTHTRIRHEQIVADGQPVIIDAEYGLNGDHVSRLRPAKSSDLSDGQQQVVLGELRATLDTHIVDLGIQEPLAEVIDDEIIDATPEEWAGIIATNERLALERQTMLDRHAGVPEAESVYTRLDTRVAKRMELVAGVLGRVDGMEVHEDTIPFVEAHLGTTEDGTEFLIAYIGENSTDVASQRMPNVIEVKDQHGTHSYVVTEGDVVSFWGAMGSEDMVEAQLLLNEHMAKLDARLQQTALELSRQDLDLRLRIPLMREGLGLGDTLHITEEIIGGVNYRLAFFDNVDNSNRHSVMVINLDAEMPRDSHTLLVPLAMDTPITLMLDDRYGPEETERVMDLVANGIDRHLGVDSDPKSDYDAVLRGISHDMGEYQPMPTEGIYRRTLDIAGRDNQQFTIEQVIDGTTGPDKPRTRVIVTYVDPINGKVAPLGTFRLDEDGFEPDGRRGPRKLLSGWTKQRRFNDLVASVFPPKAKE